MSELTLYTVHIRVPGWEKMSYELVCKPEEFKEAKKKREIELYGEVVKPCYRWVKP